MSLLEALLIAPTLAGHIALWVGLLNRLQAVGWPVPATRFLERLVILVGALMPLAWLGFVVAQGTLASPLGLADGPHWLSGSYLIACWTRLAWLGLQWSVSMRMLNPPVLESNHTLTLDVEREMETSPVSGLLFHLARRIPGNEFLHLQIRDKTLRHPGLPAALDGLTIAHLSDLHFGGGMSRDYYAWLVERTLELDADLCVVTGDLVDHDECLEWLPETLGRLSSPYGDYFVLGNHDLRVRDPDQIRGLLRDSGWLDLGARPVVRQVRGQRLLLAGNEAPWFPVAEELDSPDCLGVSPVFSGGPAAGLAADFRLLLAHSPDQIQWARRRGFELLLAGHTHGGQIRLPLIGPFVAPSRFGTRYASGVFHEPPTLMHVSRGVAGLQPLRFGDCHPEIVRLVLRTAHG